MQLSIEKVENLTLAGSGEDDPESTDGDSEPEEDSVEVDAFAESTSEFRASVNAESGSAEDMTGVVWSAGNHTMYVAGQPTPVHVPPESIPQTFSSVQEAIAAEEYPAIGLDHGDSLKSDMNPVATEIDALKVGHAKQFGLSEDGESIVLTDYELTSEEAIAAEQEGVLTEKDYSIVGKLRIHAEDGEPKTVEVDGTERLVVSAASIRQVDVVDNGAVDGAGPSAEMPPLKATASMAAQSPGSTATAFASSLRVAAQRISDTTMKDLSDLDLSDVEGADEALEAAAEVVDEKDEQIEALNEVVAAAGADPDEVEPGAVEDAVSSVEAVAEKASAADTLAEYHDVDLTAEDGVQSLVDEHTEDLREEIAAKEASLPSKDTTEDEKDERVEDLAGTSPAKLQAMNGELAQEILETEEARDQYHKAHASRDGQEGQTAGSSADDEELEEIANAAMALDDVKTFQNSSYESKAEFMAEEHGVDVADHIDTDDPAASINAELAGSDA